jgi:hypothetical protein
MKSIIEVPGNVSRLFVTRQEALQQKTAKIDLVLDEANGRHLHNRLYDSSLISHDLNYCTSNDSHLKESLSVIEKIQGFIHSLQYPRIVDIGCGQGEFVDELKSMNFHAFGYDPVLRRESEYLYRKYFEQSDIADYSDNAVLFTMRCVLPHIEKPWDFLDQLLDSGLGERKKFAYIEYQQTEWIAKNGIWQQISHDHVNLFTRVDFENRYKVLNTGEFANGEWRWILVEKSEKLSTNVIGSTISTIEIDTIIEKRLKDLERISKLEYPLAIYGAAGKGAMIAHAISSFLSLNEDLVAVDQDLNRAGLFLECSGVEVKPLNFLKEEHQKERRIIVANPNHSRWLQAEIPGVKILNL